MSHFMKIRPLGDPSFSLQSDRQTDGRTDRQTDRHMANLIIVVFRNFSKYLKNSLPDQEKKTGFLLYKLVN